MIARRLPLAAVLALAVAVAASLVAPLAGVGPAVPVRAAATDLTLVTDTTYTIQPDRNRVRVTMTIVARNNTSESRTRRFWFNHAYLAVLPTASDLKVSGAKGASVRVSKRTKDATLLRINLGSRLYSGRSRTLKLSFNLVDTGKPADRLIRVTPSLVTLPVWAHATTGAKGSTVTVRVPAGYDVTVERGEFATQRPTEDGGTELATGKLPKPLSFFAYVTAQRPAAYVDTALAVAAGGETIPLTLRGWEDDPAWAARVGGLLDETLPLLRADIGLPWPADGPTVVQEATNRSAEGYAGLFDPAAGQFEVAYWADDLVVVHQAAHGWFNGSLLADRWANEGFAALYAERAAAAAEIKGSSPELTDELREAAIPLNAWTADDPAAGADDGAGADDAAGRYGYAASLALARAIAERAGDDALRAVWADAAAGLGAYQPGGPTVGSASEAAAAGLETVDGPPDWRGLLDLLEARTGQDFTDLWREWVVRPEELALLDARAEAHSSYARTQAVAGDWALPRSIRDALRAWQFDAAEQLMADARTVLAQRGAVAAMAVKDGVSRSAEMQALFEAGDLAGASARAEAERNAMLAITGAASARSADDDPLTAIGMVGEDPDADLVAARSALADGDLDATFEHADDAYRAWSGAWQEGRRRALLGIAVLATLIVLASAIVGRWRRQQRAEAGVAVGGAASASGAPAGSRAGAPPAPAPNTNAVAWSTAARDEEPTPEELLDAASPYAGTSLVPPPSRPDTHAPA